MIYKRGILQSISRKQKLNTQNSTECELVGADNMSIMICGQNYLWKLKVTKLRRIFFTKTRSVQYF